MITPDRITPMQEIYNFLRTVTIKYHYIADSLNASIIEAGGEVDDLDPTTWKYYMNMAGQYHETDTPMNVISLENHTSILFSPDVLAKYPRTRNAYLPGTSYYRRLCQHYPTQVDLIKSILFPVKDIAKAIRAPDLTLLGYGSGFLEPQEESPIIMEIEQFLAILNKRWFFTFLNDEPLFYLTFWGSLWFHLAMLIMTTRVTNIRTGLVHSWDLWNELGAHGLDNYSDILDREKSMLLYQNIDYFTANAGKQSNLIILANRLLSSLGVGLYGRVVVQEALTGAANYQLTPQFEAVRLPTATNAGSTRVASKNTSTVQAELYALGLTRSDSEETVTALERMLGDTRLNNFPTKLLEIRPADQIKPYDTVLNGFLLETLVISIRQGFYNRSVEVVDPLTRSPLYLPPLQLLALYHYASMRSLNIIPEKFPHFCRVYRAFTPTIGTPAKTIPYGTEEIYLSMYVDTAEYLSGLTYNQINKPTDFTENVTQLWLKYLEHMLLDQSTTMTQAHQCYVYLSTLCHQRQQLSLTLVSDHPGYSSWLGPEGLDLTDNMFELYSIQDDPLVQWANLADAIITALLPLNTTLLQFGNFTLSDLGYQRLRQLFVQMCSYRVVFLESDREIGDFSVGAKWSTSYDPNRNTSVDNLTIVSDVAVADAMNDPLVMTSYTGIDTASYDLTSAQQTYQLTSQLDMVSSSAIEPIATPQPVSQTTSHDVITERMVLPSPVSAPLLVL